jgi:4-alpha-glucanotransferase
VATSGTHDIEPLAAWWDAIPPDERRAIGEVPSVRRLAPELAFESALFDERLRDLLIEALYGAGSDLLLLPVQDIFGWPDRINVPATVTRDNWNYRLPWSVETLLDNVSGRERSDVLARLSQRYGRS